MKSRYKKIYINNRTLIIARVMKLTSISNQTTCGLDMQEKEFSKSHKRETRASQNKATPKRNKCKAAIHYRRAMAFQFKGFRLKAGIGHVEGRLSTDMENTEN